MSSKTLTVRVSNETFSRLDYLAQSTARTKTYYVQEILERHLDDLEDIYLAESRLEQLKAGNSQLISWEDLKAENGL